MEKALPVVLLICCCLLLKMSNWPIPTCSRMTTILSRIKFFTTVSKRDEKKKPKTYELCLMILCPVDEENQDNHFTPTPSWVQTPNWLRKKKKGRRDHGWFFYTPTDNQYCCQHHGQHSVINVMDVSVWSAPQTAPKLPSPACSIKNWWLPTKEIRKSVLERDGL